MKIRIYYEDTDAGGIVYHTNYIKYCERARSEHFFSRGIMPGEGNKYGFVVRKITADFLGSAVLGDVLEVKTSILNFKNSSMTLLQEITNENKILFSMEVLLVYVEEGKPRRVPDHLADILMDLNKS
ncbi:YbgC/FadM family acyl-CoA thioesterase [Sulfurovum sp. zt1-1]|uniref:YbgC/FadM family acyl-CoA thioesterase n=1 Tax=Sulfurovum zhangzhouensis TaxID=3019067 RepID=A0ABT7QV84_9BACT|nr:YbgC/FadM family acyl-CoA thioesterase [Sulfurovum zhangzhouensis]MDM5270752.1 YbgC/FadM family acyl-CoA thioesterase [Sulfurovum zhangzhouensis]